MSELIKKIVIGIIITVFGGLILSVIVKSCKKEKVFYGTVIDWETRKPINNVSPSILEKVVINSVSSDQDGRFKLTITGNESKEMTLLLECRGYISKKVIRKFDLESVEDDGFIGEFEMKRDTSKDLCSAITQVIYEIVDDKVNRATPAPELRASMKSGTIVLDEAFKQLVMGKIRPYLEQLDVLEDVVCEDYIHLKEWYGKERIDSFELGEYELSPWHKIILQKVIQRIEITREGWDYNVSDINVIGTADPTEIDDYIIADTGKTGLSFKVGETLEVYFDGCTDNTTDVKGNVIPIKYGSVGASKIENNRIYGNCALSAIRAYVVAKYLNDSILNGTNTKITYAANGSIGQKEKNPLNRRVDIYINMKLAKKENKK